MKGAGSSRRSVLRQGLATGAAASIALPRIARAEAKSLYVFVHTDVKSAALERALSASLKALETTVFGKFRDLEDALAAKRPDALLAAQPVLAAQHIAISVEGMRDNKSWERYVLLTTEDRPIDQLAGLTIGVVDMLGRDETQKLLQNVLGESGIKAKLVTKLEDLLSLLLFSAADGVLTGASTVRLFQQRSRLPLRAREISGSRLGLPAVGVLNAESRSIITTAVAGLGADVNRLLGVERWSIA
ncbi:MAG TPA: hypothetical protein VJT73_03870 [Polyangiaceae bacterium]|nr:hypothetical protein [Polyangiaceae bacterium]